MNKLCLNQPPPLPPPPQQQQPTAPGRDDLAADGGGRVHHRLQLTATQWSDGRCQQTQPQRPREQKTWHRNFPASRAAHIGGYSASADSSWRM